MKIDWAVTVTFARQLFRNNSIKFMVSKGAAHAISKFQLGFKPIFYFILALLGCLRPDNLISLIRL